MRSRVGSAALVLVLLVGLLTGCGGGEQSGGNGSQNGGANDKASKQGGQAAKKDVPPRKIAVGTIVDVNAERRRIALRPTAEMQGGERMAFKVRNNAEISLDDKEAELADAKKGQDAQIEYVIVNDLPRARVVKLFSAS